MEKLLTLIGCIPGLWVCAVSLFAQNQTSFDGRLDDVFWIEVTAICCEAGGGMLGSMIYRGDRKIPGIG
ncbi:MAG TPA: hypothetical protein VHQ22_11645 [Terriglobales bacterium]|nr:hypothetical protein [Terriglobales bacterium]